MTEETDCRGAISLGPEVTPGPSGIRRWAERVDANPRGHRQPHSRAPTRPGCGWTRDAYRFICGDMLHITGA